MKISVDIHDQRLLRFSKHLKTLPEPIEPLITEVWFIEDYDDDDLWLLVSFDMTYFLELLFVFEEWSYNPAGDDVTIKEYPRHLGMVEMIRQFFNLTQEEFKSLFEFKEGTTALDVSLSIKEFVRNRIVKQK